MLDMLVRVVSPAVVTSPISGTRGAFVRLELVEDDEAIGAVILGDLVRFEGSLAGTPRRFDIVVRRTILEVPPVPAAPLETVPPELAPLLRRARGRGVLGVREHVVLVGAELRLRAALVEGQLTGPVALVTC